MTAFISLPDLFALSIQPQGINVDHLNEIYSILVNLLSKHEGLMRDFLFEEKVREQTDILFLSNFISNFMIKFALKRAAP